MHGDLYNASDSSDTFLARGDSIQTTKPYRQQFQEKDGKRRHMVEEKVGYFSADTAKMFVAQQNIHTTVCNSSTFKVQTLPWISLAVTDRHVLTTTERYVLENKLAACYSLFFCKYHNEELN